MWPHRSAMMSRASISEVTGGVRRRRHRRLTTARSKSTPRRRPGAGDPVAGHRRPRRDRPGRLCGAARSIHGVPPRLRRPPRRRRPRRGRRDDRHAARAGRGIRAGDAPWPSTARWPPIRRDIGRPWRSGRDDGTRVRLPLRRVPASGAAGASALRGLPGAGASALPGRARAARRSRHGSRPSRPRPARGS